MDGGTITIGTKLDTKQFDKQIEDLERTIQELENQLKAPKELSGLNSDDIKDIEIELEKARNKLIKLRQEKAKAEQPQGLRQLKVGMEEFSKGIQNATARISRLVLGIFGIRSAYMMLRRASSELATYDEEYAANLEYIRFVLTQAIAPVLRDIVNLAMQLLSYINAIVQAWFGINVFQGASIEDFNRMKKGANGVTGAVKELKKQLAGFDELNVLQEDGSAGVGGGSAITLPTMDLSGMQGEPPEWLKWIMDNKDLILQILGGIASAILAIKFGLGGIKALGIGIMVTGIIKAIQALRSYLQDPTWKNFGEIIKGIGIAIVGLGVIITNIPTIIAGVVIFILGIIMKNWETIRTFLLGVVDWLKEKAELVRENIGGPLSDVIDFFAGWVQYIVDIFDILFSSLRGAFDGLITFITGVFEGDWEKAWQGIQDIFSNIFGGIGAIANRVFEGLIFVIKTAVNLLIGLVEGLLNNAMSGINNFIGAINGIPRSRNSVYSSNKFTKT